MRRLKLLFLLFLSTQLEAQQLSFSLEQINAQAVIEAGLTGKGVKIGIIDGGFLKADHDKSLTAHFNNDRVKYYKDFVTPDLEPYGGSRGHDDNHGTQVWTKIGGINSESNVQFGLATNSEYYLARTDHYGYEKRQEEKFMIQAMVEMIEHGVKLINISLGYTNGYSEPSQNYHRQQIDGKSTWITRSMDSLLNKHEVTVVVSAGNDGNTKWQTLSAPADSEKVISVGATKLRTYEEADYSSKGPDWLPYTKPDISTFSTSGTSFSAPIVTGIIACMLEYDSTLSSREIKQLLARSSSLYPYPNNHLGYGVPDAGLIMKMLKNDSVDELRKKIDVSGNIYRQSLREKLPKATIYHKNGWKVLKKETVNPKSKLKVRKLEGSTQATILLTGKESREIFWKD